MNVKEYIANGIVESYIMGLLTEPERREFESVCMQYPEVAEARTAFERALENELLTDAKIPPQKIRQIVLDKISTAGPETKDAQIEEENIPVKHTGIWKWVAAASIILMAAAIYWAIDTNNKYKEQRVKNNELENQVRQSNEQLAALQQNGAGASPKSDFKMASIQEGNQTSATIYWDTLSHDVYLMINNMPQPASDKQYQLWALLPEERTAPLDLGTIELRQQRLLYRMKNVQNAKAFAITLEPKGGSRAPTSSPMVSTRPVSL